ncbi:MAG: dipeptidase [Bacteroidales bacterium]|nr:dipeptidase [Bacteroidales bacterium]
MKQYYAENKQRFLDELFEILRIPSISSSTAHKDDMFRCAEKLTELLKAAGADKADVFPTTGHPVVYGEKIIDPSLKTILVYGHYDVQPVDPIELWHSDPFQPEIRNEAIYARGANDDKGQLFMHIKAFEYIVKKGLQRHNIKFILEGEEEIGSPSLAKWAEEHKEMLKCDIMLVSDTTMIGEKTPSINCGMRGLSYMELEVDGPNKDLHSGHYGGAVVNPLNALCTIVDRLIDADGRITIKGFYDDVVELSAEDRAMLAKAPFDAKEYNEFLDIDDVNGEKGYSTPERTGIRPSLDVNGIWGGFTGEGAKTVLPSKAYAKISMRLVPNQNWRKISQLFEEHIKTITPKGVRVKVTTHHGGNGFLIPISSDAYKAAARAIGEVYGIEPVPSRGGGSIPVLAEMQQILEVDPLLIGFGLERDTIHSPNESYLLSQFEKGMESIALFYKYY